MLLGTVSSAWQALQWNWMTSALMDGAVQRNLSIMGIMEHCGHIHKQRLRQFHRVSCLSEVQCLPGGTGFQGGAGIESEKGIGMGQRREGVTLLQALG